MTFSIVAADPSAGDWGVAVASKFPAVGAVVPWARAGAGAVATQAHADVSFGPRGLDLMAEGVPAGEALQRLVTDDADRGQRQIGAVDPSGRAATFTGDRCLDWAGGLGGEHHACQGNILTGEDVVAAVDAAFRSTEGDLVDRLLAALLAGDGAGGDRRGRQSAALLVVRAAAGYGGGSDRYVDLRVDDHRRAAEELARVFEVFDREILIRNDPVLDPSAELVADLQRRLSRLGRYEGAASGEYDAATRAAIEGFAGEYNLEGKLREDDRIFESLVREIRDVTP